MNSGHTMGKQSPIGFWEHRDTSHRFQEIVLITVMRYTRRNEAGAESWGTRQHTKTVESLPDKQHRAIERFLSGWLSCNYARFSFLVCKINKISNVFYPFLLQILWFTNWVMVLYNKKGEGERERDNEWEIKSLGCLCQPPCSIIVN